jgi:hypothetical protein
LSPVLGSREPFTRRWVFEEKGEGWRISSRNG